MSVLTKGKGTKGTKEPKLRLEDIDVEAKLFSRFHLKPLRKLIDDKLVNLASSDRDARQNERSNQSQRMFKSRYYISLQMDVAQDLIYITSRCIYSRQLMILFLN